MPSETESEYDDTVRFTCKKCPGYEFLPEERQAHREWHDRQKYDRMKRQQLEWRKAEQAQFLVKDLSAIMRSTEFTDVDLKTTTRTFKAHKVLLAARSTVFCAMFSNNMMESSTNSVEITDFDEKVVEGMLQFLYTGHVENLQENAMGLLQIAEKYDLPALKEDCENILSDKFDVETAPDVLVLAHMHNASLLKANITQFINRNKAIVKNTKAFKNVARTNPIVFVDLYLSQ